MIFPLICKIEILYDLHNKVGADQSAATYDFASSYSRASPWIFRLDRVHVVDDDFPNKNTWGGFNDNDTWDLSESVENRVQRTKAARSQARSRSQSGLHPSSSF